MKAMRPLFELVLCALLVQGTPLAAQTSEPRRISRADLEDKIRGGWAGQMIGVSYGGPTEFLSNGKIIEGNFKNYLDWSPKRVKSSIHQDDLYVEMTFAEVMDDVGLDATSEQYGEMFKDSEYQLWHANAGARRLLNRGVKAPMSGHPKYNIHSDDIDFQIESDFIGLMTPGLPKEASKYADRVGRVMNWGDGLYGGMFVSGMYAAAFFETDPRKVVESGLRSIPADSNYAQLIADVLVWSEQEPDDWKAVWQMIEDKWNKNDVCVDGALQPWNIDAKLNGGYIVLGLIYGKGNFEKTMEVSTRAGQDSDCNPSSAAGILGVMLGYKGIPAKWKEGIESIADVRFDFTKYSFNQIVTSTLKRAEKVVQGAGGTVSATHLEIPMQSPVAPKLEQWRIGTPKARVGVTDPAWHFKGQFSADRTESDSGRPGRDFMVATEAGSTATLTFEGEGVAINGLPSQEGGRADVILDGKKVGVIDAWVPKNTYDVDYWHIEGLASGRHTVQIVHRSDADARSKGTKIALVEAVIYIRQPQ